MAHISVFETRRLTVKELWFNNVRKPAKIIKITGYPKSTVYDIVNRLKETGNVEHLPCPVNNATTPALMTKKLNSTYPELNVSTRTV
ncbi:8752_t:CDS:2 [Funneliformis geosporum]|uniref:8752_t:CDS:1 n=1 Tax=Funneliformis geosporum TaxID=1117311 RepID=A0A9W4T0U6_9GLOM|nr:8752_t:CDS:2 [Funneliformis geosporum]